MAYCNETLAGYAGTCASNQPGVEKVYVTNYSGSSVFTVGSDDVVSAITTASTWAVYELNPGVGHLDHATTKSLENGTLYETITTVIRLNRMDAVTRKEFNALIKGQFAAIVKDNNGIYWAMGVTHAVRSSEGTGQTGASESDGNYFEVTLSVSEPEAAYTIDPTVISGLTLVGGE